MRMKLIQALANIINIDWSIVQLYILIWEFRNLCHKCKYSFFLDLKSFPGTFSSQSLEWSNLSPIPKTGQTETSKYFQ